MADKVEFIASLKDEMSQPLDRMTGSLGKLDSAGAGISTKFLAVGAALAGVGAIATTAVTKFMDFEKTMSGVKAVLSPTSEEFDRLNKLARDLGKSTAFSALEVSESMEMLAKNGLNATQILDGATEATLNLAAATDADLATAADIATSAMLTFKMEVKDLEQVVNSITGTTNISKFGINDYALALAQGGGVAKTVGVELADFNATIAGISPLFKSGSDAGTSFKTFLLRLVPTSDEAAGAMADLGLITSDGANRFFDAEGNMRGMAEVSEILKESLVGLSEEEKNFYLNTIFGTDAMRAAAGIAGLGAEKFNELSTAIENTSAAEIAKIRMDNLKGALEQLSGATDELLLILGSLLVPVIRAGAETLTYLANELAKLEPMIKNAQTYFAQFSVDFSKVWESVRLTIDQSWAWIQANIIPKVEKFIEDVKVRVIPMVAFFQQHWDEINNVFESTWSILVLGWDTFWQTFQLIFTVAWELFAGAIKIGLSLIQGDWGGAWNAMKEMFIGIWNAIKSFLEGMLGAVTKFITDQWNIVKGSFDDLSKNATAVWSDFWNGLKGIVNSVVSEIQSIVGRIIDVVSNAINGLKELMNIASKAASFAGLGPKSFSFGGAQSNAIGGRINAGTLTRVGEKGEELFIPSQSGRIVPNHKLDEVGGGKTVNINFTFAGPVSNKEVALEYADIILKELQLSTQVV